MKKGAETCTQTCDDDSTYVDKYTDLTSLTHQIINVTCGRFLEKELGTGIENVGTSSQNRKPKDIPSKPTSEQSFDLRPSEEIEDHI